MNIVLVCMLRVFRVAVYERTLSLFVRVSLMLECP